MRWIVPLVVFFCHSSVLAAANVDSDNDGLSNIEEAALGTNPNVRDTDSDGVNDLREVGDGTAPLNPASFEPLNQGLVAYYPLDGNGSDASGFSNHATNYGATSTKDRTGDSNKALSFNGNASLLASNILSLPQVAQARALSCWVRSSRVYQPTWYGYHVVNWGYTDTLQAFGLMQYFGSTWWGYGHNVDTDSGVVADNSWSHLVVTYDGAFTRVFVNGVLRALRQMSLNTQGRDLYVGARTDNWAFFQGDIDELRVYNKALSQNEVTQLYNHKQYTAPSLVGAATKAPFDPATATNWSAGGTEWSVDTSITHDGTDSVKAKTTDGQSTYREYTVTGPAVVDFWWKVSSEQLYDTLSYSLNGVNQQTISGEVDWTYRTLTMPAGTHTIRWTYTKDGSDAVGQDAGWLDDFSVYPATATLQVRDGATALSGTTTVDFGSADLGSAGFTKTLTFANAGYVPLEVQLSLPQGSPFTFDGGAATYSLLVGRGESVGVPIRLATAAAGNKSAQLTISAPNSTTAPPSITLTGYVRGPDIGLAQGATTLTSGQTFDMGLAPRTVEFTIRNNGNVGDLVISAISATGNFQITQQPATTVPPQGSTTFKVLAQSISSGTQTGTISITSNAANLAEFSLPLSSKSLTGIAQGITDGSMATSGTGGAIGWDFATTQLPSGQNGQAIKTGATPNNGGSVLEFTSQTAGVVSWSWKVGSQENFDWLLCEVDGQEVAGISTKNGVWQTQVVQVPAGANLRWIYRKDASASAGEDAGYLADLEFRSATANQLFSQWADTHGILDPQQRLPKSGMRAKFAWLGGFDPAFSLTAGHHLPFMEGGRLKYRFPISKTADGTQQILFSGDMSAWTTRRFSQRVVSEDANRMVIEATAPSGTKGFFKVVGSGDTSMVWVEGGTLPQASELAGTTVATFQIGKTEVTWAEWQEVRSWAVANGYNLAGVGQGSGPNHPVRDISWFDAIKWCNAKSEMEGRTPVYWDSGEVYRTGNGEPAINSTADGYRLPTEAEWEWAARGGVKSQGYIYSGSNDADQVAWHADNSFGADENIWQGRGTWPVMQKIQNELGIYDMSGNVWECCWESNSGGYRHVRGGSWSMNQSNSTVSYLGFYRDPNVGGNRSYIGFRLARNAN